MQRESECPVQFTVQRKGVFEGHFTESSLGDLQFFGMLKAESEFAANNAEIC